MNVNRLAVAAVALALSFCLRPPTASAADITGEWWWVGSPVPGAPAGPTGLPPSTRGDWGGKIVFWSDGKSLHGTLDGDRLVVIQFSGNNLSFGRWVTDTSPPDPTNGSNTQTWRGVVEQEGDHLVFRGHWTGAYHFMVEEKKGNDEVVAIQGQGTTGPDRSWVELLRQMPE